jgi:hypothetical protein
MRSGQGEAEDQRCGDGYGYVYDYRGAEEGQVLIGIIVGILDNIPQYCFLLISIMSFERSTKKKFIRYRTSSSWSTSLCRNLERAEPALHCCRNTASL